MGREAARIPSVKRGEIATPSGLPKPLKVSALKVSISAV